MRLLSVFAQCFLTGALLMAQGQPTPDGSIQARNKAVAMRVFDEIFNQGKFQVADQIYAPDFQNHGLHRSVDLKTDQEAVHAEKKAFPDLRVSVQEMVAEGDKVAVLWTFQGTHTGSGYEGLPPTGTRVEVRGITIWRIVDGRIVEEWSSFSETGAYIRMFAHLKWWCTMIARLGFVNSKLLGRREYGTVLPANQQPRVVVETSRLRSLRVLSANACLQQLTVFGVDEFS
ncbi:MAG: hypothetical protein DMG71_16175 [Acidobacteria bacterium]|nr:MAG: hypothetical protein DMG71_16175 [Acidobacteriota bacterium]